MSNYPEVANAKELMELPHGSVVVFDDEIRIPLGGVEVHAVFAVQIFGDGTHVRKVLYTPGVDVELVPESLLRYPGKIVYVP